MDEREVVLVTGGSGLVGQAISNYWKNRENDEFCQKHIFLFLNRAACDLTNFEAVNKCIKSFGVKKIIHLAAKVGGVKANTDFVADFFDENILINTNVLRAAHQNNIETVVSLLSTCVYPDAEYVQYPLKEEMLHLGPPHQSNFGYAYAKRMLEVQSRAYKQQHGRNYICAIPTNIYGENDNFDLDNGHVIPAVIRKVYEAKLNGTVPVFWGDGNPLRQFTYSLDVAECLIRLLENPNIDLSNIGTNEEVSIKDVVDLVAKNLDYSGPIEWDKTKPSGQYKKPSLSTKVQCHYTPLTKGLKLTCEWFVKNYPNVRGMNNV